MIKWKVLVNGKEEKWWIGRQKKNVRGGKRRKLANCEVKKGIE